MSIVAACAKLERDLGPILTQALAASNTIEVLVNADGQIWQECFGQPLQCVGTLSPVRTEAIIKTVAGAHGKTVTAKRPVLEAVFPLDGSRFAGLIPPVVTNPIFAIRKHAVAVFTLADYIEARRMTPMQADIIQQAISKRRNILISGGTGSGKTTLINALLHEISRIAPHERLIIIEDTGEIRCTAPHYQALYTTLDTDLTQLIKSTLRLRPDRIIVGEVRGHETLDLVDAWNTGHEGGLATIHANHPVAALGRLASLITRNVHAPRDIQPLIREAVHLVIQISRTANGPQITQILEEIPDEF